MVPHGSQLHGNLGYPFICKIEDYSRGSQNQALEVADYIKAPGLKARFTMEDASRTEPKFLIEMCKEMNSTGH